MVNGKERLLEYMEWHDEKYEKEQPIFELLLFEHPDKEMFSKHDQPMGVPDTGALDIVGFFYDLDQAIQAMNENHLGIQETVYHAGFIILKYPGLYQAAGPHKRIYFKWDPEKKGFFEAEEPKIFQHVAY